MTNHSELIAYAKQFFKVRLSQKDQWGSGDYDSALDKLVDLVNDEKNQRAFVELLNKAIIDGSNLYGDLNHYHQDGKDPTHLRKRQDYYVQAATDFFNGMPQHDLIRDHFRPQPAAIKQYFIERASKTEGVDCLLAQAPELTKDPVSYFWNMIPTILSPIDQLKKNLSTAPVLAIPAKNTNTPQK